MSVEYRRRTKARFDMLELEAKIQREKLVAVVARVRPMLNCIDMEVAPQPDDKPFKGSSNKLGPVRFSHQ